MINLIDKHLVEMVNRFNNQPQEILDANSEYNRVMLQDIGPISDA